LNVYQYFLWLKAAHDQEQGDQWVASLALSFVISSLKSRSTLWYGLNVVPFEKGPDSVDFGIKHV
jgi:hypothetical protein